MCGFHPPTIPNRKQLREAFWIASLGKVTIGYSEPISDQVKEVLGSAAATGLDWDR
jgi:hypothetical protein